MNKKDYLAKRNTLLEEAQNLLNENKVEEYEVKSTEITALDEQFENYAKAQANINALKDITVPEDVKVDAKISATGEETPVDAYGTVEYRKAFMDFCKTGKVDKRLTNLDELTTVSEAAAVIPTTIMAEIIRKMESYGTLFDRVRKLNVPGGLNIPILSLKPVATWISEATPSDRKKVTVNTSVSFTYFGLECKIATSLLAETVTLASFETTIVELGAEAIVKALEISIVKGPGGTQMLGVTVDPRVVVGQHITLTAAEFDDWGAWKKKVFAKIPLGYRAGGSFIMAAGTFEGYIDGMQDANGQPIGRMNYGIADAPQERFGGRQVILVEDDVVTPYDTAAVTDVVAIFMNPKDYVINSNLQMKVYRWLDQDKNEWVDKVIVIVDGKLADTNGVLLIKKGA